jgi:nucleoside-diphosphate-sugar epimerase
MTRERVLVTGATGFVGQRAAAALRDAGAEVHGVARGHLPVPDIANVAWHRADLHDRAAVDALLDAVRPSHLLHLAWTVTPGYLTSRANLRWVGASIHLVEAFTRAGGRRALLAGTSAEYAALPHPCVEDRTPIAPATLYAACKRAVYEVIERWCAQEDVSFGWARLFFLYGPGESPARLVPQLMRAGLARTPFPMRHPEQVRDYMHVEDAAAALAAFLRSDVRDAVNIASGQALRLDELADRVGECVGRPLILQPVPAEPDLLATVAAADTTRLRTDVGFAPRYSLATGLRHTLEWWKTRGDLVVT